MNICFLIGKIISDIEFKFIINSRNISVTLFEIELSNKSIIKIKGYDEIADRCYRELLKKDIVAIQGYLNNEMEIIIEEIEVL